jgi:hypothetical protein
MGIMAALSRRIGRPPVSPLTRPAAGLATSHRGEHLGLASPSKTIRAGISALTLVAAACGSSSQGTGNPLQNGVPISPDGGISIPTNPDARIDSGGKEVGPAVPWLLPEAQFVYLGGKDTQIKSMPPIKFELNTVGKITKLTLTFWSNPRLFDKGAPCLPGAMSLKCEIPDAGAADMQKYSCKLNPAGDPKDEGNRLAIAFASYSLTDNITGEKYNVTTSVKDWWTKHQIGAVCGGEASGKPLTIEFPAAAIHTEGDTTQANFTLVLDLAIDTRNYVYGFYGIRFEGKIAGE